jgi:hypothetical protein
VRSAFLSRCSTVQAARRGVSSRQACNRDQHRRGSGWRHIPWQGSKAPQIARQHRVVTAITKSLTDAQRKLLEFSVQIFDEPTVVK